MGEFSDSPRTRRGKRLSVVCSRLEVQQLLRRVEELVVRLLHGTGMRIAECLRVQYISFDRNEITVRSGKGDKDRRVPFPTSLQEDLRGQLE